MPPRHRGVLLARDEATRRGWSEDDVLILQADADTIYDENYVAAMRDAAELAPGAMIKGVAHTDPGFLAAHPGFFRLCEFADRSTASSVVPEEDEIIIDD